MVTFLIVLGVIAGLVVLAFAVDWFAAGRMKKQLHRHPGRSHGNVEPTENTHINHGLMVRDTTSPRHWSGPGLG